MEGLIGRFTLAHQVCERSLASGLKFIMEHSIYNEVLRLSTSYAANYTKQIKSSPAGLSRIEIDRLTADSDSLKKLALVLARQFKQPQEATIYGPLSTQAFFRRVEGVFAAL